MKIRKSKGTTPTEKLLSDLCERTFLKFWSYPNPYRKDKKGKELCDLIAVFENHLFIFFVKEIGALNNLDKEISVTWPRWKKEAIDKQIENLKGAGKYIRSGSPIFVDRKRKTKLPVNIRKNAKIHKFIVAHGAEKALKELSADDYHGSLAISYKECSESSTDKPFCIELDKADPVHVLDDRSFEIVLRELDTIYDFTSFIEEKEETIKACDSLLYLGEHDLLGQYFLSYDEEQNIYRLNPEKPDFSIITIDGFWEYFSGTEEYKRRKKANEISYLWDELIQSVYQDALDGTLLNNVDLARGNDPVHEMAKEPRFMRRVLSEEIRKEVRNFPETDDIVLPKVKFMRSFYKDKGYVLLQLKCPQTGDFEARYRPVRQKMLEVACGVIRNRYTHLNTVIGIAMYASKFSNGNSRDFMLLDCSEWTREKRRHYERENQSFGFFRSENIQETRKRVQEFPDDSTE